MRTVAPSGTTRHGAFARSIAFLSANIASAFVSRCATRSGDMAMTSPSCNSHRPSRPSAQPRNSSTVISGLAAVDMQATLSLPARPANQSYFPYSPPKILLKKSLALCPGWRPTLGIDAGGTGASSTAGVLAARTAGAGAGVAAAAGAPATAGDRPPPRPPDGGV